MDLNIKRYLRNGFVKDVTTVATGTVIAQLIILLFIPIVTRIYGPEAYGLMGIFMSLLAVIVPLAALTLPIGIVLPKKNTDSLDIMKVSIVISRILSIITLVVLIFTYETIASILKFDSVSYLLFLIPIVVLNAGTSQILRQWLIRQRRFKLISRVAIYEPIIIYGCMVIIGFFLPISSVLIIFIAIKTGVSAVLMYFLIKREKGDIFDQLRKHKTNILTTLRKYRDFPLFRAPQELINSTSQSLPVLLLATFFGPAAAGFYSIGRTALSIPTKLIGNAVGDVFYPKISQASREGENIGKLLIKATIILFLVGVFPFSIIMFFGPTLFSVVFGLEWSIAGEYSRWLSLWLLFNFSSRACIKALPVLSAQRFYLVFTIVTLLFRIMALYVGFYYYKSDIIAVALFSVTGAILDILLICITIYFSKHFQAKN